MGDLCSIGTDDEVAEIDRMTEDRRKVLLGGGGIGGNFLRPVAEPLFPSVEIHRKQSGAPADDDLRELWIDLDFQAGIDLALPEPFVPMPIGPFAGDEFSHDFSVGRIEHENPRSTSGGGEDAL